MPKKELTRKSIKKKKGCSPAHITKALHELRVAANNYNESLYTTPISSMRLLRG
jgi:Trp operon repressor